MTDARDSEAAAPIGLEAVAATPPVAQASFVCCRDAAHAGTVSLHHDSAADVWVVFVESFVCRQFTRVAPQSAAALKHALTQADAGRLAALDMEFAPFWCPECGLTYCGDCWRQVLVFDEDFPDWLDQTRGWCPQQHERMLVD